jgi:ankyrin repeat protein
MLRSRLDKLVFRILAVIVLVVCLLFGIPYGWNAYQTVQRSRFINAAAQGDTATVQTMLKKGFSPNLKQKKEGSDNNAEYSAFEHAVENGHLETTRALLAAGAEASLNAQYKAAAHPDPSFLLAMVDHKHLSPEQALTNATSAQNSRAAKALFEKFPKLKPEIDRSRLLNDSARDGNVAFIQMLLELGADINNKDQFLITPLMRVAAMGRADAVRFLLSHGANARLQNYEGNTAYDYAQQQNRTEVMQILKENNAAVVSNPNIAAEGDAGRNLASMDVARIMLSNDKINEVIEVCRKTLKANPLASEPHLILGATFIKQGKFANAVQEFRTALKLDPKNAHCHYYLGLALKRIHRDAEADSELRTYVRLVQNLPEEEVESWRAQIEDAKRRLGQE